MLVGLPRPIAPNEATAHGCCGNRTPLLIMRRSPTPYISRVRLVTSDDHRGLKAAIDGHFQGAGWQRCQVHFARDLIKLVGAGRRAELAANLREIFAATTCEQALTTTETVAARWESSHPAVARLLEEGVEDCLACLVFPLAHRARIRTTNGLERLHEEIKRRTRMVPGALWADSQTRRLVCDW